jgi:energy-coupling factor transporter ATP-binding protein EcfA2
MATATPSHARGSGTPDDLGDRRTAAFCSPRFPELFHAFAYANDIWKHDAFDVESIHRDAREKFQRIVGRVLEPSGLAAGRILLLLGESGCGKTHLMRAFRNQVHSRNTGYCGYLQMTAFTGQYGRYVLNNLIDSLDKPYDQSRSETTGLMRLSSVLAETGRDIPRDRLDQLREGGLDQQSINHLVGELADAVILDDRFSTIDVYLVQALLYLQSNDPRIKARVLKYLRCEDLTEHDRRLLGGIVPCIYPDAPHRIIERLGLLIWAVERAPLVLCVDQLEDVFDLDEAAIKFRRAMATLCDIVSRLPSAIVVIACLDNFYDELKKLLTRPIVDRVESDPAPVSLQSPCDPDEVEKLIGQRLKFLYESMDIPFQPDQPSYPLPGALVQKLTGLRARDVLSEVQVYREHCIAKGKMAEYPFEGIDRGDRERGQQIIPLEQAWNELRSTFAPVVPIDESELAAVLVEAIRSCSDEVETVEHFEAEAAGRMVSVERHAVDRSVECILAGVCNKAAQGGGLGRQIDEVVKRAGEHTPVIVRSTDFPTNPKAAVSRQLGELITGGGRRVVVQDSDWRAMMALASFRKQSGSAPNFAAWIKQTHPLTSLNSLRAILDLDHVGRRSSSAAFAPRAIPSPPPEPMECLVAGTASGRRGEPVTIEPGELTRHAAFLGAPGSGKTTAALCVVEQLLLRGVPAILVDRKGDLCSYARADMGLRVGLEGELADCAARLRATVEVGLFTPRRPEGRPLSIAAVSAGLGALPAHEREQAAKFSAAALAGMMNYSDRNRDQSCLAILSRAIDLLSQETPQEAVPIETLVAFIAERDPGLLSAVGRLDVKLFDHLVQDLETLRLNQGDLLAAQGEPLDVEALLGLGAHRTPGKTRLSVISTKFLGTNQDVQFWVAQFLITLRRWISRSPHPSGSLQAVLLFDEADLYLPAVRLPPTKEPMEYLLRRARSAGLGLLLATQSPGDFDYKCRDNIRTWFAGQVKEANSIAKMKPMLSDCRVDVAARLPSQETGEFFLIRGKGVTGLRTRLSAVDPRQVPEDEIVALARRTRLRSAGEVGVTGLASLS